MARTDAVEVSLLARETRAVLRALDELAASRPDMDPPTTDLLSRVHVDLVALIDLLERGGRPEDADDTRCHAYPGEI